MWVIFLAGQVAPMEQAPIQQVMNYPSTSSVKEVTNVATTLLLGTESYLFYPEIQQAMNEEGQAWYGLGVAIQEKLDNPDNRDIDHRIFFWKSHLVDKIVAGIEVIHTYPVFSANRMYIDPLSCTLPGSSNLDEIDNSIGHIRQALTEIIDSLITKPQFVQTPNHAWGVYEQTLRDIIAQIQNPCEEMQDWRAISMALIQNQAYIEKRLQETTAELVTTKRRTEELCKQLEASKPRTEESCGELEPPEPNVKCKCFSSYGTRVSPVLNELAENKKC